MTAHTPSPIIAPRIRRALAAPAFALAFASALALAGGAAAAQSASPAGGQAAQAASGMASAAEPVAVAASAPLTAAASAAMNGALQPPAQAADLASIDISGLEFNTRIPTVGQGGGEVLFLLASLRNGGPKALSGPLLLEARFYDAQGALLDAFTKTEYGIDLLPGQHTMVRLEDVPRFAPARYARAELRLVHAEFEQVRAGSAAEWAGGDAAGDAACDGEGCSPSSNAWLAELRHWWVFLLVMAVMGVLLAHQTRNARKIQHGYVVRQLDFLERNTRALETLAAQGEAGRTALGAAGAPGTPPSPSPSCQAPQT